MWLDIPQINQKARRNTMKDNFTRKYRQTLLLGLIKVIQELFPEEILKIPYSILDGVYCEFSGSLVSPREVRLIETTLKNWATHKNFIKFLGKDESFHIYKLDETIIKSIYAAFEDTSAIKDFRLIPFQPGFILDFSDESGYLADFVLPKKLSATYTETQRWLEILDLAEVKDVNSYIRNGRSIDLINIAEALQEKKIADIADIITNENKNVRIVLISGPSSSGKTTFTHRLSTQLIVNGLKPISLSLDNYYLNRENIPRDASGQLDFDTLYSLDLALLNEHLDKLIMGETVQTPVFNFFTGKRNPDGNDIRLDSDNILLVEGLHALNPGLLTINRNSFFKIYISALFLLNIDRHNRVPTTEARLIRRIVRDDKFRGFGPERTLNQWPSVRRGENTSVFRYQEEADIMFNSSLLFEMNALRSFAEPLLKKIQETNRFYDTSVRLLNLLSFFEPMDTSNIPLNSILREFIGGSIYCE
ncbi:Uridine kinase [Dehalobacter sp. UNSWDHB]|jgi:Uridine kinase|nr:Uridine kinase [Dehalobacter sp. DCA]AFV04437.1 Uridine kinase [Dehalobacter sp. CF]EQB21341.1 Uridine kinase [Dehalobacter sp. UNSWDHB]